MNHLKERFDIDIEFREKKRNEALLIPDGIPLYIPPPVEPYDETHVVAGKVPQFDAMCNGLGLLDNRFLGDETLLVIGAVLKRMYPHGIALDLFNRVSMAASSYHGPGYVERVFNEIVYVPEHSFGTLCYYIRESNARKYVGWKRSLVSDGHLLEGDMGLARAYYFYHGATHLRITSTKGHGFLYEDKRYLWIENDNALLQNVVGSSLHEGLVMPRLHALEQEMKATTDRQEHKLLEQLAKSLNKVRQKVINTSSMKGIAKQLLAKRLCYAPEFRKYVNSVKHEVPIRGGYVLDLKTGDSRRRTARDLWSFELGVSNRDPVNKESKEKAHRFLLSICNNDAKLMKYLIEVLGYCLTGETTERTLWILTGSGSNGKSRLLTLLDLIMTRFFATLSEAVLIDNEKVGAGATPELVPLLTARLGILSETSEGAKLNARRVKSLTGNEKITMRALYEKQTTFAPKCKFLLITNHIPWSDPTDKAMIHRKKIIPFDNIFENTKANNDFCAWRS